MKLAYVLIDSRKEFLEETVQKHLPFCPSGDLFIHTYESHIKNLTEDFSKYEYNTTFKIISDDEPFLQHNFNLLLTDITFWEEYLNYDRVIIFQVDSEIFRTGLEEFLEYDYIGAPWKNYDKDYYPYVGNGGLSIRNPKVMYNVLKDHRWGRNEGEDLFLVRNMVDGGYGKLAPYEVAQKFAVESILQFGTLGAHDIDRWFSPEICNKIRTQYDNI